MTYIEIPQTKISHIQETKNKLKIEIQDVFCELKRLKFKILYTIKFGIDLSVCIKQFFFLFFIKNWNGTIGSFGKHFDG